MRKTWQRITCGALAAMMLPACTMTPERRDQLLGTIVGAGVGAATGALAGRGRPEAIVAGALAGGAVGFTAVKLVQYHSERTQNATQQARLLGWEPSQGMLVRIKDAQALPQTVSPGQVVDLELEYAIMAPSATERIPVEEKWVLYKDGKVLAEVPPHREMREPGGWIARASIEVPRKAMGGTYIVENSVSAGSSYDLRRADFLVNSQVASIVADGSGM